MKVGVVGAGFVGAAAANALVLRHVATDVVLVDVNETKAAAEAADIAHVTPFSAPVRVGAGGYEQLAGSAVVVITAGRAQQPGQSRLELLRANARILRSVVAEVVAAAPDAVLLVATNPVDVMTRVIEQHAGLGGGRVFGTGTMLDTARFRQIVAARVGVDVTHVHGYVVGEHGDSEVLIWSSLDVAGRHLAAFVHAMGGAFGQEDRAEVEDEVVNAAERIIRGKGATYYGVAAAIAGAVEVILRNRRSIMTVSAWTPEYGCSLSLPRLVSGPGVIRELGVSMDGGERSRLERSAEILRGALAQIGT
ncbi:MAG TPA: L-lactate dehydrogenase [Actinomycetota bacterium]|jgi:L-lactate dehydrogenase|nr:L-lactate dehydrogenase [Actinomycetota bacterium]